MHQVWLLAAVQPQAVVTAKVVDPASAATFWFEGATAKVQATEAVAPVNVPVDVKPLAVS